MVGDVSMLVTELHVFEFSVCFASSAHIHVAALNYQHVQALDCQSNPPDAHRGAGP